MRRGAARCGRPSTSKASAPQCRLAATTTRPPPQSVAHSRPRRSRAFAQVVCPPPSAPWARFSASSSPRTCAGNHAEPVTDEGLRCECSVVQLGEPAIRTPERPGAGGSDGARFTDLSHDQLARTGSQWAAGHGSREASGEVARLLTARERRLCLDERAARRTQAGRDHSDASAAQRPHQPRAKTVTELLATEDP
jgi:hypothetical protein